MKEKPKNKASKARKWLIALGIFLLIICAGFGLFIILLVNALSALPPYNEPVDLQGEEAREAIESEIIRIPLPEDAYDIYLHYKYDGEGIDFMANIRFSVSPETPEIWLNGHDFCFTNLIENEPAYYFRDKPNLEWWQANDATRYSVAYRCGSNPFYELVIDQSNSDFWIVYLYIEES